jgi:hypothetical protein
MSRALEWTEVAARLAPARSYWLHTTSPDDPRVAIHLPDPEDCLIVHGALADLGHPRQHPQVMAALDEAYPDPADGAYLPSGDPAFDVLYALVPTRARAWRLADWDDSQATWRATR